MKFGIGGHLARVGIDAEGRGGSPARDGVADLSGDRDGTQPGQGVGQVAKTFAEIDGRRVGVERIGSDAIGAGAAPFDAQPERHNEFMLRVLEDPILESRIEILKSVSADPGGPARRTEDAVGRADRDRKRFGNPLGKFTGEVTLSK